MQKIKDVVICSIIFCVLLMMGSTQIYAKEETTVNSKNITTSINKVTGINTSISENKVVINWNKVNGADGYEIIITVPNSNTQWKYDWKYSAITFSNFPNGIGYKLEIKAYKTVNGTKQYGQVSDTVYFNVGKASEITDAKPKQVTGVKIVVKNQNVTLSWDKAENAKGYQIIFTEPISKKQWKYNWNSNKMTFSSFPYGTGYKVQIKAYNTKNGKTQYGTASKAKTFNVKRKASDPSIKIEKVANVSTEISNKKIIVKWNEIKGIDGYEVLFTVPNSKTQWKYDWQNNKITFNNFPTGKGYKVQIRAYKTVNNAKQYGELSNAVSFNIK